MRVGLVKNWQDFVMTLGLAVPVALSPNNVFADYGYQSVNEVALDISPKCEWVTSNSGTGKVDVPSGICDVRNAIVTEP